MVDFGVSKEFFDLVYTLSGSQRYLQIEAYIKLTPDSGVRVYPDTGVIEGVYEAYEGYEEAQKREDLEMMIWFAERSKGKVEEIPDFVDEPMIFVDQGDTLERLINATLWGRVDILDEIIHKVFTLPKGFSIARDIPKYHNYADEDFWENKGYLLDLPLQGHSSLQELLLNSFLSGDTRIADFYLSIFRNKEQEIARAARMSHFGDRSLFWHHKPEETYGIALRTLRYSSGDRLPKHMVEVAFYLGRGKSDFLFTHMGDVASLMAILPLCTREDVSGAFALLEFHDVDYKYFYPLSTMLLEQSLQA